MGYSVGVEVNGAPPAAAGTFHVDTRSPRGKWSMMRLAPHAQRSMV